jgi:hypothetical protein
MGSSAYTHGAELPDSRAHDLAGLVATMVDVSYIKQQEATELSRRTSALRYVIYAPLGYEPGLS